MGKIKFKELLGYALNPGGYDDDDDDPLEDVITLSRFRAQREEEDDDDEGDDAAIGGEDWEEITEEEAELMRQRFDENMNMGESALQRLVQLAAPLQSGGVPDATPSEFASTALVAHSHLLFARMAAIESEDEQEAERSIRIVQNILTQISSYAGFRD